MFLWLLWASAIFAGSSVPGRSLPDFSVLSADKLLHAGVYAVFAWFGMSALRTLWPAFRGCRFYGSVFLVHLLYGLSDEWHQSFVPNRSCELFDLLADAAGVGIAMVLYYRYADQLKVKTN